MSASRRRAALQLGNEFIEFKARFGGVSRRDHRAGRPRGGDLCARERPGHGVPGADRSQHGSAGARAPSRRAPTTAARGLRRPAAWQQWPERRADSAERRSTRRGTRIRHDPAAPGSGRPSLKRINSRALLQSAHAAGLAQLVEHPPCKRKVIRSIRIAGTRAPGHRRRARQHLDPQGRRATRVTMRPPARLQLAQLGGGEVRGQQCPAGIERPAARQAERAGAAATVKRALDHAGAQQASGSLRPARPPRTARRDGAWGSQHGRATACASVRWTLRIAGPARPRRRDAKIAACRPLALLRAGRRDAAALVPCRLQGGPVQAHAAFRPARPRASAAPPTPAPPPHVAQAS